MNLDPSTDYFALFQIEVSYDLNLSDLQAVYQNLQTVIHPDRHSQASDRVRREMIQKAAFLNEAYQTLKDPLKRGLYMLKLKGVELGNQGGALDASFLAEQMEARELLSTVRTKENPLQVLRSFEADLNERINSLYEAVNKSFKENNLESAKSELLKQQFLKKLYEECRDLELIIIEEED